MTESLPKFELLFQPSDQELDKTKGFLLVPVHNRTFQLLELFFRDV